MFRFTNGLESHDIKDGLAAIKDGLAAMLLKGNLKAISRLLQDDIFQDGCV
jgi:hypothetical protein